MLPATCAGPGCSELLSKPKRGPMPRFHSAVCRVRAHQAANPDKVQQYKRTRNAKNREASLTKTCPWCGDRMSKRRRQCGKPDCRRKQDALRQREFKARHKSETGRPYEDRYAEERRAAVIFRKALKRGANGGEVFDEREVFERDGWVCGICLEPVDPGLRFPDMRRASLDHVIPVSFGGPHTRANTRCSHLDCNVARGNRMEADAA